MLLRKTLPSWAILYLISVFDVKLDGCSFMFKMMNLRKYNISGNNKLIFSKFDPLKCWKNKTNRNIGKNTTSNPSVKDIRPPLFSNFSLLKDFKGGTCVLSEMFTLDRMLNFFDLNGNLVSQVRILHSYNVLLKLAIRKLLIDIILFNKKHPVKVGYGRLNHVKFWFLCVI